MKRLAIYLFTATVFGVYAPVSAQTPDTTSAWRYFPLEVGNVWEYERRTENCYFDQPCDPVEFQGYLRRVVSEDSVVEGQRYAIVHEREFYPDGQPGIGFERLVRFDTLDAHLYSRNEQGGENYWPRGFDCPLDAPLGVEIICPLSLYTYVSGSYAYEQQIGDDEVVTSLKEYFGYLNSSTFAAGIGEVYNLQGKFATAWRTLTYARIDGEEYGVQQFPVANETGASLESSVALSVYPNPARGPATLNVVLDRPQRATLAVYDVLGRRILSEDLGALPAGERMHRLDLTALPPGVYLVRLDGDAGARATARLVRQ